MTLRNLRDVIQLANASGNHWFEPSTMHWFRSRLCESLTRVGRDGAVYFVTSERQTNPYETDGPRLYTVRRAAVVKASDGSDRLDISTVGDFQQHATRNDAYKALCQHIATIKGQ